MTLKNASNRAGMLLWSVVAALSACSVTDPTKPMSFRMIAAESWFTCGIAETMETYCWGGVPGWRITPNPLDSLIPTSATPLLVPGRHPFTTISVGEGVICGVQLNGAAYCWGTNEMGQNGDGTLFAKRGPSLVTGGHQWKSVDAGMAHVCGVDVENKAYCWGNSFGGALGNGVVDFAAFVEPVPVAGGLTFSDVWAGGGSSCALTMDGEAYCWGGTPSKVVTDLRFTTLAMGNYNVCGLTADQRAYCWGSGGVLGNGSGEASSTPVPVSGGLRWQSLSVGNGHTCGLATDRAAYCWGNGERGRFGDGYTGIALTPRLVAPPGTYVAITAGGYHTCARNAAGIAYCWGHGDYGQLGQGRYQDELFPVQVVAPQ